MKYDNRVKADNEIIKQPDYSEGPLKWSEKTVRRKGIYFLAGEGPSPSDVMFIAPCALPDEVRTVADTATGAKLRIDPRYLRSASGVMFADCMQQGGVNINDCYYTALCKWLLPKAQRSKIPKDIINYAFPALETEIEKVKPKIIVCTSKQVFDLFCDWKVKHKDARGGWFWSEKYQVRLYLLEDIEKLIYKPELIETFKTDAREISRMVAEISGHAVPRVSLQYETITNRNELIAFVVRMLKSEHRTFAVDCEWHGQNHIDGQLRSLQLAWAAGKAAYIRFMDDTLSYVFDVPYKEAGDVLKPLLDHKDTKYIGHHWPADAPWLHHVLGLEWYNKCIFDTEFAQQTVNEYEELSLERLALKYTDLGRYDIELLISKKELKIDKDEGYGRIPDKIIIPYALRDVDTCIRVYPILKARMEDQELTEYYNTILHPFVSDVFTNFCLLGLPIDIEQLDNLREVYTYARNKLENNLRIKIGQESKIFLLRRMLDIDSANTMQCFSKIDGLVNEGKIDEAWEDFKIFCGTPALVVKLKSIFDHYANSSQFNLRSNIHMKRWLYDVKGYEPIKSTSNKEKGIPATDWSIVKTWDPYKQKSVSPAVDKQTLQILSEAHNDYLLKDLVRLNAVGNICKGFLKQADTNSDLNIIKENGLHSFICSDGRIHGQMSTTETGRPRSWKPNSLNWPGYVNNYVSEGIEQALQDEVLDGSLNPLFNKFVSPEGRIVIPSIRSCVKAPPGYCFVESDYQTAEVRGLAFISGDENLIRLMTGVDPSFGYVYDEEKHDYVLKRIIKFDASRSWSEDLSTYAYDPNLKLKRDKDNNIIHPAYDLHWELAEMVKQQPRESLKKKIDRDGIGKTGNFQTAYGATPNALERKIEQSTGTEPEEGIGERILNALDLRQPVAQQFLKDMEMKPRDPGYIRAASGRIRHFVTHGDRFDRMVDYSTMQRLYGGMGREARNFLMQESVAATAARAGQWLLRAFRSCDMVARPLIILYDALVTLCPLHERFRVAEMHQMFMTDANTWVYHNRKMNYPIDTDFCYRWSTPPTEEEARQLNDKTWKVKKH